MEEYIGAESEEIVYQFDMKVPKKAYIKNTYNKTYTVLNAIDIILGLLVFPICLVIMFIFMIVLWGCNIIMLLLG